MDAAAKAKAKARESALQTQAQRKRDRGAMSRSPCNGSNDHLLSTHQEIKIKHMIGAIDAGGCPHCDSADSKKSGKLKCGSIVVQKYLCKVCKRYFPSSLHDVAANKPYGAFAERRKLQALFHDAYGALVRRDMTQDELRFERRTASLQRQLTEKRRRVADFAGVPTENVRENARQIAGDGSGDEHPMPTEGTPPAGDPYREAILLLARESPELERVVTRLLHRRRDGEARDGETRSVSTAPRNGTAENDEFTHVVDVVNNSPSERPTRNDEGYKLASRILQEDGGEIQILEKCGEDVP